MERVFKIKDLYIKNELIFNFVPLQNYIISLLGTHD